MYGDYYDKQQPIFGNKGIGCKDCVFSMYGTTKLVTWTTLADNIYPGEKVLETVDNITEWKVGDIIIIAATDYDHTHA